MQVDVLSPVTRGAPEGERPCDICRATGVPLNECRVLGRYWWDLCPTCAYTLQAVRVTGEEPERQRRAFDEAKAKIRTRVQEAAERLLQSQERALVKGKAP